MHLQLEKAEVFCASQKFYIKRSNHLKPLEYPQTDSLYQNITNQENKIVTLNMPGLRRSSDLGKI